VGWAQLAERLEVKQILDLTFTGGAYETLAFMFRSVAIEITTTCAKPSSAGQSSRELATPSLPHPLQRRPQPCTTRGGALHAPRA
jgi:hypothetical protein